MPDRNGAQFFVEELPDVFVRDGMFHCVYSSGDWRLELVMPPRIFHAGMSNAGKIQREFLSRDCKVINLEPQTKFERVYPADKAG